MRQKGLSIRTGVILLGIFLLAGCNFPGLGTPEGPNTPSPRRDTPTPPADDSVSVTANLDDVETISAAGITAPLPAPEVKFLEVGDSVDVSEAGRAILQFADLLTVEVLRDGALQLQTVDLDDQSAFITVLQNGGVLVNDFDPQEEIDRRLTVQTEFATITATGTRFMVVREEGSPLEWVVGLDAVPGDLQVTAEGVTKDVVGSEARWIAPIGEPSAGIQAEMGSIQDWIGNLQAGQEVPELGETLWPQADVLLDTSSITDLPQPGEPFALGDIVLTLAQGGEYALQDCNGDFINDIAVFGGAIDFDFRNVLNRVRALDVSVVNREGSGLLQAFDPGREVVTGEDVPFNYDQTEILSLRAELPFHYAGLSLDNGCFLGLSLTPPDANGAPGAPRTPVLGQNSIVIDSPTDSSSGIENGFTLTGRATIPIEEIEGTLWVRVEQLNGEPLLETPIFYREWDSEKGVGQFSTPIFVEAELPADIRIRVQRRSLETQEVVFEDIVIVKSLRPYSRTDQRPPPYGFITALRVGSGSPYDVTIDIDGEDGDWTSLVEQNTAGTLAFSNFVYDQGCARRYPESPEFASDLLGVVRLAYDDEALYIHFTVYDDGYEGYTGEDERYFLGDAPQLLLDLDLPGDFEDEQDSRDDIELDFLPGRDEPGDSPQVALWRLDTLDSRVMEEARIAARFIQFLNGSYFLEAAIPWESLGMKPVPGMRLGFAASVSDNDTPGTDVQECMISSTPERDWQNPTTWGTLELEP